MGGGGLADFSSIEALLKVLLHAICLELLRLILAEGGGGGRSSRGGSRGERLLDGVAVPRRGHVARRRRRGRVRVLLVGGGGGGGRGGRGVLGVRGPGVVEVRRSGSGSCRGGSGGLHVWDHDTGLHESLGVDVMGGDSVGGERYTRGQRRASVGRASNDETTKQAPQIRQFSHQNTANPFIYN